MIFDTRHITILRRLSIAYLCSSILIGISIGQTKPSLTKNKIDIEIYGGQNGNLYTNGSNLITVLSSQGIVWQLDKYMFFVDSLKKGKTTITIYKTNFGNKIKVQQKDYSVLIPKYVSKYNSLTISPEISLGGFTSGKVKLDTLKKINSLTINDNYRILKATFYIGIVDHLSNSIKSKYFDKQLAEIWQRIGPNCTIIIDNIEFMDKNGNHYFYPKPISILATE
jgi:hypothetical protein